MTPPLVIRPARDEDFDRIVWLEHAAFPDPWPPDLLAYEMRHPNSLMLAAAWSEDGPACGYAAFRHGGGEAELLRVAVDPAEQGRGIGKALVARGLIELRDLDIQSCFLEVRPNNASAISCYTRLGFGLAGRRRNYYRDGSDALVYARGL